jgi:hypothetical protein
VGKKFTPFTKNLPHLVKKDFILLVIKQNIFFVFSQKFKREKLKIKRNVVKNRRESGFTQNVFKTITPSVVDD